MKKNIKLILIILSIFIVVGCGNTSGAKGVVESYLDNYKNLDNDLKDKISNLIEEEDLTEEQEKKYQTVLERQYEDLKYEIVGEEYNGDEAEVEAEITVYDYYKVQQEVTDYLKLHREEFNTEGEYDENLYLDYKLDTMKNYTETVTYTIEFHLKKERGKWIMENLSDDDIEKIHGIYNYKKD